MLKRIIIPSPNFSERGAAVRLLVLHTAEGARTIEDLGHFFSNPVEKVSSHAGADDTPNTVGVYVADANKAWTCADFNSVSLNLETCAFTAWSEAQWMLHPNMLFNIAAWIAEESKKYSIPIVKLTAADAQSGGRGVCQHKDLGAAGGGHVDCGPGFPIDHVLAMAKQIANPTPPPPPDPHHYLYHPSSKPGAPGLRGGPFEVGPNRKVDERERVMTYDKMMKHPLLHKRGLKVVKNDLWHLSRRLLELKGAGPWPVDNRHLEARFFGLNNRAEGGTP